MQLALLKASDVNMVYLPADDHISKQPQWKTFGKIMGKIEAVSFDPMCTHLDRLENYPSLTVFELAVCASWQFVW